MPKSHDKTKGSRKRKQTPNNSCANTESDGSETKPGPKKKKVQKKNTFMEGIAMSKQLAAEVQKKQIVRNLNPTKKNTEPRLLGNGKPMPSLAELEAMYATSDDDEDAPKETVTTKTERCSTPPSKLVPTDMINLDSPETLKKVTSKVIDIISKKVIELDDDGPPPPVIPQKKPKKGDKPYIIGCKDRPQVPWAPKTKFCVGIDDYGIDPNQIPDEEEPKKRKKRGVPINISKSIFNAKSDEIAERLKELDSNVPPRTESPDSNKTIEYDFPNNSPRENSSRSFSPLPSTSRDSKTILKNDKLFNESLHVETLPVENLPDINDSQDDVEIIDIPTETIVITDTLPNTGVKSVKRRLIDLNDDSCILVEPEIKKKRPCDSSRISESPTDDIYGSIDLTQTYDSEVYEINDDEIDSLIAENKAILGKDVAKNHINTINAEVVIVEPESVIERTENIIPNPLNTNRSEDMCPPAIIESEEMHTIPDNTNNNSIETQVIQERRSEEISGVVTNFFNQPVQNNVNNSRTPNESSSADNLTSSTYQDTMMSRISSWIHSLESLFSGRQNYRRHANNDIEVVNDRLPSNNVSPRSHNNRRRRRELGCSCPEEYATYIISTTNNIQRGREALNCDYPESSFILEESSDDCICPEDSPCRITPQSTSNQRGRDIQIPASVLSHQQTPSRVTSQPSPSQRTIGDCPICMDSLANSSVASTMCGHVFCMPCIKAAIRANGKKCPTCRKALKGVGYHQLFL